MVHGYKNHVDGLFWALVMAENVQIKANLLNASVTMFWVSVNQLWATPESCFLRLYLFTFC